MRAPPVRGERERGGAGLLLLLSTAALLLGALVALGLVVDVVASHTRARTAADAAALAAMATSPLAGGDGNPCAAAATLARGNGAELVACPDTAAGQGEPGWPLQVKVTVRVAPRGVLARRLVPEVRAEATAALRPATPLGVVPAAGAAGPTGMVAPVDGPITSGFGPRVHPILGTYRLHAGIDYGVPAGTPVRAAADGEVVFAGWRGGYGRTVVLDHRGGTTTLYAHLLRITVAPGQQVAAGQVIGAVGSTGLSTGPHLHFEVRVGGVPVDPLSVGISPTVELTVTLRR